jgi:hypothetical protein
MILRRLFRKPTVVSDGSLPVHPMSLLECLFQIKVLAETPARFARLVDSAADARVPPGGRSAADVLDWLAEIEARELARLREMIGPGPAPLAADDGVSAPLDSHGLKTPVAVALARFRGQRLATVSLLSPCTTAQLSRIGAWPGRGPTTVADVVALKVAREADAYGEIRVALGLG